MSHAQKVSATFPGRGEAPMLLIIGGHPRSGTTMLTYVCNTHPDIALTFEFQSFLRLGSAYDEYLASLRMDWQTRAVIDARKEYSLFSKIRNRLFISRFLNAMRPYRGEVVTIEILRSVLHQVFPRVKIAGDKFPRYIWQMPDLAQTPNLIPVVIYRDCRDVVQSTLRMVRTSWKGKPFVESLDTADKIAAHWVDTMNWTEEHQDLLHIIRYEEMVQDPTSVLARLSAKLGVDRLGFSKNSVWPTAIGRYREILTPEELEAVMDIAGPTLTHWGYEEKKP